MLLTNFLPASGGSNIEVTKEVADVTTQMNLTQRPVKTPTMVTAEFVHRVM